MAPPSTIQTWLLGGLGLLSVSMLFYFMFWKKPNGVPAIKDKDDAPTASKSTPVPAPASTASKSVPASAPKKVVESDVIVEDAEDDDEEEEEEVEGGWDAELEELKTKYEDANRLSSKYIQGQKYEKAIEKLTEAIELAPKVPSGGKDIMTLYNNRSAMYEKLNTFDKSLADISVILAMEPLHIKARVRKARIHEAQGKMRPALDEYVLASLLLQQKQEPGHQHKIEALAKVLALKSAPALFQRLRASTTIRPLPSKSHCKNFLDSYPSVQLWTEHYRGANREDLTAAVKAVQGVDAAEEEGSAQSKEVQLRQATLDLIAFDLVHNRFESAFSLLTTIPLPELPADTSSELDSSVPLTYLTPFSEEHRSNAQMLLSLQYELVGFEKHLRCDLDGAVSCLLTSLRAYPNNIDARLKLANVYLEQPDAAACTAAYDSLLAFLESQEAAAKEAGAMVEEEEGGDVLQVLAVMKGWALLHKVSVYVTRNEKGEFSPTAIEDALRDVKQALDAAEPVKHTLEGKAVMVTGLVRSIHVLMQTKPTMGIATTEEDLELCKSYVAVAKALSPYNEAVMLMEAELLNNEGRIDEALALIDQMEKRPDAIANDCTPICVRASILLTKAMGIYSNPSSMEDMRTAQEMIQQVAGMYKQALEMEPNAVEVLNQYAQFAGMFMETDKAVELLTQAMPLARTRDDVQDLNQMLITQESQQSAVNILRSTMAM